MNYGDFVRLLTLLSGAVLAWSSWKQYDWQRTQATRDAEAERAREELENESRPALEPEAMPAVDTPEARRLREKLNAAKLRYVAAQNAARPFFDKRAFVYFLGGFVLSVAASLVDILYSGTITRLVAAAMRIVTGSQ